MLVMVQNTKINSEIKEISYGYYLKEKFLYFSVYPWDGCGVVEHKITNGKDSLTFYIQDQKVADSISKVNEDEILNKLNRKKELKKEFDYSGKTFLVYFPKNIIIANLTDREEFVGFNSDRPVRIIGNPSAFVAIYLDDKHEPTFCRIKNDPSVISMVNFRSEADKLMSPKTINDFGTDVVFQLANDVHPGGRKKESHIRSAEHVRPLEKKLGDFPIDKIYKIFYEDLMPKQIPSKINNDPNNKFSLAQITVKGFIPDITEGQITMDVSLSVKSIISAEIKKGVLIFYTNNIDDVKGDVVKNNLSEELGLDPISIRYRETT